MSNNQSSGRQSDSITKDEQGKAGQKNMSSENKNDNNSAESNKKENRTSQQNAQGGGQSR